MRGEWVVLGCRVAALSLVGLALAGCGGEAAPEPDVEVPIVLDASNVIAEGRLVPGDSVELGFKAGGVVAQVLVGEGEAVQAGQPLAVLANLEQAQAAVATAQLELLNAQQALDLIHEQAGVTLAQAQVEVADAREELRKARYTWDVQQQGNRARQSTPNGAEARLLRCVDTWTERTVRLFVADCAEHVLPLFEGTYPDDRRPRQAIEAARAYARGELTDAAWAAAGDAAWAAAGDAERAWQTERLMNYLRGEIT